MEYTSATTLHYSAHTIDRLREYENFASKRSLDSSKCCARAFVIRATKNGTSK
jgi:hypothetical protein